MGASSEKSEPEDETNLSTRRVLLSTETRIQCLDDHSRKRFRLYWGLIGPFSAWIRREMLRAVKKQVESEDFRRGATGI